MYQQEALQLLHRCCTDKGFTASPSETDNYKKIWSRDSMIGGLTSVLIEDEKGIAAFRSAILLLADHQSVNGQIPSNVSLDEKHISYGSLAGRVDATTWWIIGACVMIKREPELLPLLKSKIIKAKKACDAWEFNDRGLMYTPLGGNWADEYISQGYVLYDQLLRLWAVRAYSYVELTPECRHKADSLESVIVRNFDFSVKYTDGLYHPSAYESAWEPMPYWPMSLSPAGYDKRFDMAANALVLILGLHPRPDALENHLLSIMEKMQHAMLPVFYPIITPENNEWSLLHQNFSFRFKNEPHHFHNGGSWPVWLGMLAVGFKLQGKEKIATLLREQYHVVMQSTDPAHRFSEYWDTKNLHAGGVSELLFSASGYLLLNNHLPEVAEIKKRWIC